MQNAAAVLVVSCPCWEQAEDEPAFQSQMCQGDIREPGERGLRSCPHGCAPALLSHSATVNHPIGSEGRQFTSKPWRSGVSQRPRLGTPSSPRPPSVTLFRSCLKQHFQSRKLEAHTTHGTTHVTGKSLRPSSAALQRYGHGQVAFFLAHPHFSSL